MLYSKIEQKKISIAQTDAWFTVKEWKKIQENHWDWTSQLGDKEG